MPEQLAQVHRRLLSLNSEVSPIGSRRQNDRTRGTKPRLSNLVLSIASPRRLPKAFCQRRQQTHCPPRSRVPVNAGHETRQDGKAISSTKLTRHK